MSQFHLSPFLKPLLPGLLVTLLCLGTSAHAQVQRCTDLKSGRVTYTNGSCISGEASVQVQQAQTPQQIADERAKALAAVSRSQTEMAKNEQLREQQAREDNAAAQRQLAQTKSNQGPGSAACAQATQAYNAVLAEKDPDPDTWGNRGFAAQQKMEMSCMSAADYQQLQQARVLRPNAINRPWYGPRGRVN